MTPYHDADLNAFANVETVICATPPKAERLWLLFAMPDDQVYSTTRPDVNQALRLNMVKTLKRPPLVSADLPHYRQLVPREY